MDFALPIAGLLISVIVMFVRETGLPKLARHRLQRGRGVTVHARLRLAERTEQASVSRSGPDLLIATRRRTWVVPAAEVAAARGRTSSDETEERWTVRLRSRDGTPASLEVPRHWRPVVQALAEAGRLGEADTSRRLGPPYPRWAAGVATTSAITLVTWLGVLFRTTERRSPVLRVTDDEDLACWVEWVEDGVTHQGAPTCPDPLPMVGDQMRYLTTPWPVQGNAWDTELPWVLAVLLGLGVLVAAGRLLVAAAQRSRPRDPQPVTVIDAGTGPGRPGPQASTETARSKPFMTGLDRAEAHLGWADVPVGTPPRAGWWSDLRRSAAAAPRWPWFVAAAAGAFAAGAGEDGDTSTTAIALAVAGAALAWAAIRAVMLVAVLRRPWRDPVANPWAYRSLQDGSGTWWLVLLEGGDAQWLVPMPERPPLQGTCRVRGPLAPEAAVHVFIDGVLWLPSGSAVEVDADVEAEISDDLDYQMTGDLPDPSRTSG